MPYNAPERIYMDEFGDVVPIWGEPDPGVTWPLFIRVDIHEAAIAQVRREAREEALQEAVAVHEAAIRASAECETLRSLLLIQEKNFDPAVKGAMREARAAALEEAALLVESEEAIWGVADRIRALIKETRD